MKFLLCIHNQSEATRNIIRLTIKVAEGFGADLNIIVVGRKTGGFMESEISIAQQSLAEWNLYQPGIDLLHWAFNRIIEYGHIKEDPKVFNPENFIEEDNRIRIVLPHSSGSKVNLILRNGKLLNELRAESKENKYELTIVERPKKKNITHRLIQFINSSLFIVPNFDPNFKYPILLGVNDSKFTKRAVMYSAIISKQFGSYVKSLTVSKSKKFRKGYQDASKWADKYLKRLKVDHEYNLITGSAEEKFILESGTKHIIVIGQADRNEIQKYLFGSKPIHIAQKANCPILIVK
jgi:nucleotide-binding universal stress UspA family protein